MDAMAVSGAGLRAAEAQFTTSASQVVRSVAPAPARASGGSSGGLASGDDLASGLVGQMTALAGYRANAKVFEAADRMAKVTIDLIG